MVFNHTACYSLYCSKITNIKSMPKKSFLSEKRPFFLPENHNHSVFLLRKNGTFRILPLRLQNALRARHIFGVLAAGFLSGYPFVVKPLFSALQPLFVYFLSTHPNYGKHFEHRPHRPAGQVSYSFS